MDSANLSAENLREKIDATEKQLQRLKAQLAQLAQLEESSKVEHVTREAENTEKPERQWPLSQEEYTRYGRQMIVPSIGIQGQLRLHNARVLIIGAGGLGCPAAAYIAGTGVKTLGIVDGDTVELSNLHRQILHNESTIGMFKVDSAIRNLKKLNPNVEYKAYPEHLSPQNAASIVSGYDIVLDCTDHPSSRYLISDICVLLHKPLVSASALRTDGQLMILNHPAAARGSLSGGPCYRCIFPIPPPADQVMSCGDGGILGPVVGVMGVLQALEAIKLVVAGAAERPLPSETSQLEEEQKITPTPAPALLLFSANSPSPFRTVKLRPRRPGCFACSGSSLLTLETLGSGSLDYVAFCGSSAPSSLLSPFDQITAPEYAKIRVEEQEHILLDVREKVQFEIAHLEGSVNVPFSKIQGARDGGSLEKLLPLDHSAEGEIGEEGNSDRRSIYVLCRMGNDSQVVTRKLKEFGLEKDGRVIREVRGGLRAWKRDVDRSWPEY